MSAVVSVDLDDLLKELFYSWRSYKMVLHRLQAIYGIKRSLRWLKGQFSRLGLRRRPDRYTCTAIVINCIKNELRTSSSLLGYRSMWRILTQKYHLQVKRSTVMYILRVIDPEGVSARAKHRILRRVYISKGPNCTWHIDQYDKLAQFGFYIHGCIDGFSRKILWLKLASTNKDPAVTLGYYLDCLGTLRGCPRVTRFDKGVENSLIAECQVALRLHHSDSLSGMKSIRFGSSPTNSRIESLWSKLRLMKMEWWIISLKNLQQNGDYDSNNDIQRQCLAVVLESLLSRELSDFVTYWNTHRIRAKSAIECPSGIPNDMFEIPEEYGGEDYLCPVNHDIWLYYSLNVKRKAQAMFEDHFYCSCNAATTLRFGVDLYRDVTHTNWINVYKYLVNNCL